ncbi:MAG: AAA family ATPase, partial [Planctomycetota bacterium]
MRILRITLKNLASLSGEHTVDFTAEPLRSAGLFALIGPTGSGKSTLLDAMCLALYDKTPRLKQAPGSGEQVDGISQQDSRSLLRRGARDGFAEVAFVSTDGQTFTSRWSVHRAGQKKQVAGKLQPVEMVLLRGDVRGGTDAEQVCGGRKTLVLEAIEERIGLKFEQFTRAVLLAQNEFATFLRSKDDERMEILEALTATQKYRRISQGVYQRAKKESDRIRDLETRCEGQVPLSETERAEKETERQRAKEKLTQTTGTLETLQALKRWHQDHSECTDSLELAKAKHAEAAQNIAAAETRQSRLRRIEHAQREATVKYQDRQSAQQRREKLDTDVSAAAEQLSLARQSLNAAIAAEETAQRQQTELIESQTSAQQKLQSAIAFQPQVQPAEQAAKAAEDRLKSATKRRNEQANRLRECEQAIAAGKKTREDITQQLLPLESLQPFAADSSLWISRLLTLETAARDETASRKHDAECSAALAAARLEHDNYQTASRQRQAELIQHHQQLTELEARIRGLNGEQLRQTERSLSARQRYLERLKSQLEQRTQLEQTLEARQQELADEQQKQQADEQQIADLKTQESAAAEERRIADLAVTYLNNTFDDHAKRLRATLEPGQKCPVCGATEHPFQNTPADLELSVLQIAREKFREKTEAHEKLKGRLQKLKTAVEQRTPRVQSLSAEIERKKRDRGR